MDANYLILGALYMLPTIIAMLRRRQAASVTVINLFLGWTIIGWVIALAMAVSERRRATI
jgi:predicted Abi (CAAX) family protease